MQQTNRKGRTVYVGPKGGKYILKNGKKIYFSSKSKMLKACPPGTMIRPHTGRCVKLTRARAMNAEIDIDENARALDMLRKNILPKLRQGRLTNYF